MMWTNAMHSDTAYDHHVFPVIIETRPERVGRINIIAVE
ncbi:hypothetical protein BSIN_5322 [Burkholderia singularis]|uniref:Uncharacterized protein n=1 Tax=Burkholderia singularis TaxID=1503053 RepID=A0A238HCJ0_9BURK|nr:hypothetical protein BSIN_5322 [Burkholderia singularis]